MTSETATSPVAGIAAAGVGLPARVPVMPTPEADSQIQVDDGNLDASVAAARHQIAALREAMARAEARMAKAVAEVRDLLAESMALHDRANGLCTSLAAAERLLDPAGAGGPEALA